jgi:hypothetical protein
MHGTGGGCNTVTPHQGDPEFESTDQDDAGFFREVTMDSAATRLQGTVKDPRFAKHSLERTMRHHTAQRTN